MHTLIRLIVLAGMMFGNPSGSIAATDLAKAPINYMLSTKVKPNLFFILDDSGSMKATHLGDEVIINGYEKTIGYRSPLCNKVYYNPAVNYPIPVNSDGMPYPSQNFNAALYDGFNSASVSVNLASGFTAWRTDRSILPVPTSTNSVEYFIDCFNGIGASCTIDNNDYPNIPEPAYYFIYRGNKPEKLGDNSSEDHCRDKSASDRWQKIIVSNNSGINASDERSNFANWYSYHRTRILTMKTAVGRAFRALDDQFRVGFSTIGESGVDSERPGFLKISDFDATQRGKFYTKLYATRPVSSTPLRAALSKAGRIYAGKLLFGNDDPIRFSCQQNFAILTTDGYWNTSWETANYGPKAIDGQTDVGDQDHDLSRPMFDGALGTTNIRAAKLVITLMPGAARKFISISSVKVNNEELLQYSPIGFTAGNDLQFAASTMAFNIERFINQAGFRAVALGAEVYIISPTSTLSGTPTVVATDTLSITVGAFENISSSDRKANTLADVAAYYFQTDLRQPAFSNCPADRDVCTNNVAVAPNTRDGSHQHMVTHTVGLGASGTLNYRDDYAEAAEGDYREIVEGNRSWPDPLFYSGPERIDDLWHAAVNGGGRYFNATSPESIARALGNTLANIRAAIGAAAAAATSSQEPSTGNNLLFTTQYRSVYWDGEIEARRINLSDGNVSSQLEWAAADLLDKRINRNSDTRKIYLQSASDAKMLKNFSWSALDTNERIAFDQPCGTTAALSQCAGFSGTENSAATGERLLNYLRGHRNFENRLDNNLRLFRHRDHALGATVNAQPLYVGRPAFRYADENYGVFRDQAQASRKSMVYVAANDGMLHAFDADTGNETWALVPAGVLTSMKRIADVNFPRTFSYVLDGTPVAADICPVASVTSCTKETWRTILVGGLGAAGREFYALDITDADNPQALWRFSVDNDADLGYALGKPLVTKRRDGRWVVVLTSGYNNINPGDGKGYIYVLDAYSGELLLKQGTGSGGNTAPSGLAQLNGWIESTLDNTTSRFYGGDLLGNLWRFDIDDLTPPEGKEAFLLARFVNDGKSQPITTRPELSEIRLGTQRIPVVTVGTGSYLGIADIADKAVQTIYTVKDELNDTSWGDVRASGKLVAQQLSSGSMSNVQSIADKKVVDWVANAGWYLDLNRLSGSGERITLDPEQQMGVLRIVSNIPDGAACRPGAESWIYEIDYLTGSYLPLATDAIVAKKITDSSLIAGARTLKLGEKIITLLTDEKGKVFTTNNLSPAFTVNPVRRVSWRELDE